MSKGSVTNLLLMVMLVVLIGLHWLVLPDPGRRNYEFLPGMVYSVPHDAQTAPPSLDGVPIDLRPPVGSIVRGYLPFDYAKTPEDAQRAGRELVNPYAMDDASAVRRGAKVYENYCGVCHGAAGRGNGSVTKRGVPPPPSLLLKHALDMSDGQMYHVLSVGQGNMPSYASQVAREDRWRVILHVRGLQQSGQATAGNEAKQELSKDTGASPATAAPVGGQH
jgi:mono/diheme cytochrome c family protein